MKARVGLVLFFLFAASLACFGRREETTEQLIARAEAAPLPQQSDLFLEAAERQLKAAIEDFKSNKDEKGRAALDDIVKYSDKAYSASIKANKKQKHTEIKLRKISTRLRDIKMNVGVDQQSHVQDVVDKLEQFRTELLKSMFGSKKK
jgi:hypothetical protein